MRTTGKTGKYQLVPGYSQTVKILSLQGTIIRRRRDCHKSRQLKSRQCIHLTCQGFKRIKSNAGLTVFLVDIYLQENIKRGQAFRTLVIQALGNFEAVDTMDPVE